MKKAFSWVVTLALLLGLVPGFAAQTAQAESTVNWEKLERQLQQELGINGVWKTYAAKEEPALEDGYYQIGTAAELAWFANYVNAGNNTANAKLVADIDLTGHCWTQIGTSDHPFNGVLDGNHHKISALHISKINGAGSERGLIGQPSYSFMYAENGTLKNVLFEKPILAVSLGINESASLLGCFGNKSDQYSNPSVIDVEVLNAVVYINCEEWGGRAANQSAFPILSMYGGFYKEDTTVDGVFHADSSNREDCGVLRGLYVNGGEFKVSGGTLAKFTTMSEVLCYLETADVYDCVFHVASFEAPDNDKGAHTLVISYWPDIFAEPQQTAKDIDSVHGAYTNLEKYSAADPQSYPDLSYYYSDIYSYDDGNLEYKAEADFTAENVYSWLGGDKTGTWALDGDMLKFGDLDAGSIEPQPIDKGSWRDYVATEEPELQDGYYQIGTAEQLAWFASHVNAGNTDANAKLIADIDLDDHYWDSIGDYHHPFSGKFDGDYHTISNMLLDSAATLKGSNSEKVMGFLYAGGVGNQTAQLSRVRFEAPYLYVASSNNTVLIAASLIGTFGNWNTSVSEAKVTDVEVHNAEVMIESSTMASYYPILEMYSGALSGLYVNGGTFEANRVDEKVTDNYVDTLCLTVDTAASNCVFNVKSFEAYAGGEQAEACTLMDYDDDQETGLFDVDKTSDIFTNLQVVASDFTKELEWKIADNHSVTHKDAADFTALNVYNWLGADETGSWSVVGDELVFGYHSVAPSVTGEWEFISGDDYDYSQLADGKKIAILKSTDAEEANGYMLKGYSLYARADEQGKVCYLALVNATETEDTLNAALSAATTANRELASSSTYNLRGDVNGDGVVDVDDASFLADVYNENASATADWQILSLDINCDGTFNVADLVAIMMIIATA